MIEYGKERQRRRHPFKYNKSLSTEVRVSKRIRYPCSSDRQLPLIYKGHLMTRRLRFKSKQQAEINICGGACGLMRQSPQNLTTFFNILKNTSYLFIRIL